MSRKFYIFKCVQDEKVLYVGTTSRDIRTRIAGLKRKHPENNASITEWEIYYLECKNREYMMRMKAGAIIYYNPSYNQNYVIGVDAIIMNYDVLDWKRYGVKEENVGQRTVKNIPPIGLMINRNTPVSLDNWTIACPDGITLTNEHMEILSFIYGNPSIGGIPHEYTFYGMAPFHLFVQKYGSPRVAEIIDDLAKIRILPPKDASNLPKIAALSYPFINRWINVQVPVISYSPKSLDSKRKAIVRIDPDTWHCVYEMLQAIMASELFYVWYVGNDTHDASIETCWVSLTEYDASWGFKFMNPLLRYETGFHEICKRCGYRLAS